MARKLLSLVCVLLLSASVTAIGDEDEYAILFGNPIAAPPAPGTRTSNIPGPTPSSYDPDVPEPTSTRTPPPHRAQEADEDEDTILFGNPIAAPPAPGTRTSNIPGPTPSYDPDVPEPSSTGTPPPHRAQKEDESTMEELSNTPRFKTKLNDYASSLRSSGNSDIYKGSSGAGSGNLLKGDMLDNMKGDSGDTSSGYSSPYLTPKKASGGGYGSSGSAGTSNYGFGGNSAYAGAGSAGTGNYKASMSTESGAGDGTGIDLD